MAPAEVELESLSSLDDVAVSDIELGTTTSRLTLAHLGQTWNFTARFVVDASGRDGFLARRQGLRLRNQNHSSAAIFTHFDGVPEAAWATPGNIGIHWFEHGWIWMIPLSKTLTSVGVVCMTGYAKTRNGPLDEFFFDTLRLCPYIWDSLSTARRVAPVRGAGNYSYRASKSYGDGFLLVGDAYAFVDPVFSSGVLVAMQSAESAVNAVDAYLNHPTTAATAFRAHQQEIDIFIKRLSWLIHRFNTPTMRRLFTTHRDYFRIRAAVTSLLVGDMSTHGMSWRLTLFKVLFTVSRLLNIREARDWKRKRIDSFEGSIASITFCLSICFGKGS